MVLEIFYLCITSLGAPCCFFMFFCFFPFCSSVKGEVFWWIFASLGVGDFRWVCLFWSIGFLVFFFCLFVLFPGWFFFIVFFISVGLDCGTVFFEWSSGLFFLWVYWFLGLIFLLRC